MYRLTTFSVTGYDDGSVSDYLPRIEFTNFREASKVLHESLRSNNIKAKHHPYCVPGYGYVCRRGKKRLGAVYITKVGVEDELLEEHE